MGNKKKKLELGKSRHPRALSVSGYVCGIQTAHTNVLFGQQRRGAPVECVSVCVGRRILFLLHTALFTGSLVCAFPHFPIHISPAVSILPRVCGVLYVLEPVTEPGRHRCRTNED